MAPKKRGQTEEKGLGNWLFEEVARIVSFDRTNVYASTTAKCLNLYCGLLLKRLD